MKRAVLALGLLLSTAVHAGAAGWTLVHRAKSPDYGYQYFDRAGDALFALPGVPRSEDGGRTWTDGEALPDYSDVAFASGQVGVASALDILYISTDGGRRWNESGAAPRSSHVPILRFFGGDDGFGFDGGLIATHDGGKTWTAQSELDAVARPDPRALFVLGEDRAWIAVEAGDAARVMRTDDRGRSWKSIELKDEPAPQALCFADARHGWLATGHADPKAAALLSTEDGGATWRRLGLASAKAARVTSLACRDPETVWAAGPELMLSSSDGGKSWSTMPAPLPPDGTERKDVGILYQRAEDGGALLFGTYETKALSGPDGTIESVVGGAIYRLKLDGGR
jgi:photosystem II stability/assembly factor-like uncharacterized protein